MIEIGSISRSAYYTAKETQKLLGISRDTLRRRTSSGEILSHVNPRTGRRYYHGAELLRYIKSNIGGTLWSSRRRKGGAK